MKLGPLLYLTIALIASLLLNGWQWQHNSGKTASATGVLNLCTTANDSQVLANSATQARMWECVGESTKDIKAAERTAQTRAASDAKAIAATQARNLELTHAYLTPSCTDWGKLPVCPAVSRLYAGSSEAGGTGARARTGPEAVPAK
ncbi:MAG: hypothetical protein ABIR16_09035 [Dokdonella sp.]